MVVNNEQQLRKFLHETRHIDIDSKTIFDQPVGDVKFQKDHPLVFEFIQKVLPQKKITQKSKDEHSSIEFQEASSKSQDPKK